MRDISFQLYIKIPMKILNVCLVKKGEHYEIKIHWPYQDSEIQ